MTGSTMSGSDWDRENGEPEDVIAGIPNLEAADDAEGDGARQVTERLALEDDDTSLPWLESDGDDDDDTGNDAGRLLAFVLAGLAVLALIVGGIWWATHRNSDPELVADGSTIKAPAAPFKEAPRDPGGKTFDGTGDSSFSVSEGKNPAARLGQNGEAPRPSIDVGPSPAPSAAAAIKPGAAPGKPAGAPPPDLSGVGVQVGAYSSRASAEAGWTRLQSENEALTGVRHRVVEGQADIGTVYRLQAVAGDVAGANALCGKLKAAGVSCQVKN